MRKASILFRFFAFVVDILVLFFFISLLFAAIVTGYLLSSGSILIPQISLLTFIFACGSLFTFIFYFTYLTMNGGATVGKRFFQLRVLHQDGSGLNAGRAFMRTMIYPLSLTLWFVNVLFALLLDGRMIHDIVVGSWVVRVEL